MMFLRNHGTLTHGRSIAEAFTLMHYLERSCEIQVAAQAGARSRCRPMKSSRAPSRPRKGSATGASARSASPRSSAASTARIRATAIERAQSGPGTWNSGASDFVRARNCL